MAELVTVKLELIYVNPSQVSPRDPACDEDYLARLGAALEHGESLPPLRLARLADPTAPEWTGVAPHTKLGGARRRQQQEERPYTWLPPLPAWALYDGHSVYWALREAGVREHSCEIDAEPVSDLRELALLALIANSRNGRALTDGDFRRAFCRLWLGRQPRTSYESWTPEREALADEEIARRLGRSSSWVTKMKSYAQVHQVIGLDLGLTRSYELARLADVARWRSVVWDGDQLRLYVPRDGHGQAQGGALKTIPEMNREELRHLVNWLLIQEPAVGSDLPLPPPTPREPVVEPAYYQGTLPDCDWTEFRDRAEEIHTLAQQLNNAQLLDVLSACRPAYVSMRSAYDALVDEARRRGLAVSQVAA